MPEKVDCHVSLHYVLPPEERDLWDAQDEETKASWRNALGGAEQIDGSGESGNYVVRLDERQIGAFNESRNCRYVVPEVEVSVHGDPDAVEILEDEPLNPEDIIASNLAFPDPATMRYHSAAGTEADRSVGKGFLAFHLDTGASAVMERMTPGGIVGRVNTTGEGTRSVTSDPNGHGSLTLSLLAPLGLAVYVMKVLRNSGSGSSVGIVEAIRIAAAYVKSNPRYKGKAIISGSIGGGFQKFQPYVDACRDAEAAGILCRFSAGNDGRYGIAAPGNWKEDRASIAFHRPTDRRASFSNHHESAGLSTEGEQILMIDKTGRLVRGNGTSFSLPVWNRHTFVGAYLAGVGVFEMNRAELATARNSPEPTREEAHGVLDVKKAVAKAKAGGREAPKDGDDREREGTLYRVQVGTFAEKQNAENLVKKLRGEGYSDAFIVKGENVG